MEILDFVFENFENIFLALHQKFPRVRYILTIVYHTFLVNFFVQRLFLEVTNNIHCSSESVPFYAMLGMEVGQAFGTVGLRMVKDGVHLFFLFEDGVLFFGLTRKFLDVGFA